MNIAVIGAGYWGKNLIRNFHELKALRSICDFDPSTLERFKGLYPGVICTSLLAEVLADKKTEGIVVSTPAETHYHIAKEAILAGKDVFVEKPLSLNVEDALELVELAKKHKRILMVGHLLEYHPGILKLKELIDKGELGRIYYIYSNRVNLGKIRREENILWSFAPHDISVMLLLLNELPVTVAVHGGNYLHENIADVTVSNLEFKSGVKGHIFVSWLHPYKEQKLIVVGDKKMAMFDDVAKTDKLRIFNHKIDWIDRVPVSTSSTAETVEFDGSEPLKAECAHFLDCINTRKTPQTDGANGIRVLKVLRSCQESLEKRGAVIHMENVPGSHEGVFIHHTATVDEPCSIGSGTKIWHYSHVMKGAKIGSNCQLGQNVLVSPTAEIGDNVKVQNNISIYDAVKIEDGAFLGPSCVFTNVFNPRSHIPRKHEYRRTIVKKGATIGANATIVCGVTIGEYAFIGAGAVVTKDVPAHALVYGNPASVKGWMCKCGEKLTVKGRTGTCRVCSSRTAIPSGAAQKRKKIS